MKSTSTEIILTPTQAAMLTVKKDINWDLPPPMQFSDEERRMLEYHGPIDWTQSFRSVREVIEHASANAAKLPRCKLAPKGWRCSSYEGHKTACPAWPDSLWLRVKYAFKFGSLSYLIGRHT